VKRIVVCCDGTWNSIDRDHAVPSNVGRIARAIAPSDGDGITQVVYYGAGVGTHNLFDQLTGGAFGIGISRNVRDAYRFIVHNYAEGDELYFFGFSRGAFTVRSTTGFIRNVGILRKQFDHRVNEGWDLYKRRDAGPDGEDAVRLREACSVYPVRVKFLGVWDTVGALGMPGLLNFIGRKRFAFHDVALSRSVDHAYHAIAIDEKRRFFRPTLWEQHPEPGGQVLEQAWFPGVHADVGGGYVEQGLADCTLDWMVQKARATGLAFDDAYLDSICHPNALDMLHESRNGPYRLIPALSRPIAEGISKQDAAYDPPGSTRESLDGSAQTRHGEDATYRPPGLMKYLGRTRDA
jgi:uncharacterized protein (DUF2235 family)